MADIEQLKKARYELAEMYSGVRFHGVKGKNYWSKWLEKNDWFFDTCQSAIAETLKQREIESSQL